MNRACSTLSHEQYGEQCEDQNEYDESEQQAPAAFDPAVATIGQVLEVPRDGAPGQHPVERDEGEVERNPQPVRARQAEDLDGGHGPRDGDCRHHDEHGNQHSAPELSGI